jgi:16S rRNA (uracil1498-N3)-methyltransferase
MHRFFLPTTSIQSGQVTFTEAVSRQMAQVLRLKVDAVVMVLDGIGNEYQVRLTTVDAHGCEGFIESSSVSSNEPKTQVTLYLCLTQREKFEWILQKCTEVGVTTFVPVISSRSLIQDPREVENKFERWQRILQEASEQSHRGRVPVLEKPLNYSTAVKQASSSNACCLIPWEEETSLSLREAMRHNTSDNVILLVGPEGGFSKAEVDLACQHGFHSVTLGKRILRMETAAVVASALVLYERGEMGSLSDQAAG